MRSPRSEAPSLDHPLAEAPSQRRPLLSQRSARGDDDRAILPPRSVVRRRFAPCGLPRGAEPRSASPKRGIFGQRRRRSNSATRNETRSHLAMLSNLAHRHARVSARAQVLHCSPPFDRLAFVVRATSQNPFGVARRPRDPSRGIGPLRVARHEEGDDRAPARRPLERSIVTSARSRIQERSVRHVPAKAHLLAPPPRRGGAA